MEAYQDLYSRPRRSLAPNLALVLVWLALVDCGSEPVTISRIAVPSPDSEWIAVARTDQWAGPGNAALHVIVTLRHRGSQPDSVDVLDQDEEHAPPIDIYLEWRAPRALVISYTQSANIELQTVRVANVDIAACGPGALGNMTVCPNAQPAGPDSSSRQPPER
jgi:hypothetical protein